MLFSKWYIHTMKLSNKKGQTTNIQNNLNGSQGYYAECKKPNSEVTPQ